MANQQTRVTQSPSGRRLRSAAQSQISAQVASQTIPFGAGNRVDLTDPEPITIDEIREGIQFRVRGRIGASLASSPLGAWKPGFQVIAVFFDAEGNSLGGGPVPNCLGQATPDLSATPSLLDIGTLEGVGVVTAPADARSVTFQMTAGDYGSGSQGVLLLNPSVGTGGAVIEVDQLVEGQA